MTSPGDPRDRLRRRRVADRVGAIGLQFPQLPDDAGVYGFRFTGHGRDGDVIGEASQLKRRLQLDDPYVRARPRDPDEVTHSGRSALAADGSHLLYCADRSAPWDAP